MKWNQPNTAPTTGIQILVEVVHGYFQVVAWHENAWRENTNSMALRGDFIRWAEITI